MSDNVPPAQLVPARVGNHGCGHHKDRPLLYVPPAKHQPRPHPLCDLEKQNQVIYKLLRKKRRTSSPRRVRSECRDAAQVACCCCLHYLDRKTMTIRIPESGLGIGYALIADQTKMRYRRVRRAFKVLYEIEWVEAERQAMRVENGQLLWLPSMRQFTRAFFVALKKASWYDSWTGRGQKKAQKKAMATEAARKAQEEAPRDPLQVLLQRVLRRAGGFREVGLKLTKRVWEMISYGRNKDEDELVKFLEPLYGGTRAAMKPPGGFSGSN